jgi:radical SAM-linked protein
LRVRIRFQKLGKVRFVGHRDVARIFERALRKVGFPVTYSEGFSPRVKLSFGLALPTCYESVGEFLDVPIEEASLVAERIELIGQGAGDSVTCAELVDRLSAALPAGIDVTALVIEPRGGPSLQESIVSCTWQFDIIGCSRETAESAIDQMLAADILTVERNKKGTMIEEDIRAGVHLLYVEGESDRGAVVVAELSATPRVIRPAELLNAIAPGSEMGVARRQHQWTECEGARREPLPPATTHSGPASPTRAQEGTPE